MKFRKNIQYYKFCLYGFFKNLRFFDAFLLLFFLEKGLSFFEIGTLYAVREITVNILEIPTGIIADSMGRRRIMILAFSLYIISFVVFYFSETYGLLFLAMIVYSSGDAFRSGSHKAMIYEYLVLNRWEELQVHYYGHTRSWSQMGSALSAIIGAAIVFYTGQYRYIFLVSIIPYLLDLVLISTYPRELDGEIRRFDRKKVGANFREVFRAFVLAIRNLFVLKAISNLSIYSGYYKAVKDYLQPMLKTMALALPIFISLADKQRAAIMVGSVFFIVYLLTSVASRNSGKFADSFRNITLPLNLTLIAGYLAGTLSGVFYGINLYWISVVLFISIYIIENLRKPIGVAYVTKAVDKKILASALSTDSQVKALTAAILAPVIGLVADYMGVGLAVIIVSLVMLLTSFFYQARLR